MNHFSAVSVNNSNAMVTGTPTMMRQISGSQQANTPLSTPGGIQQRAIMGQNTLQTSTPNMPPRPINISPNPLTRPIVGTPVPMGIPLTGRLPIPPTGVAQNSLMLQQMMQGGISPAAARGRNDIPKSWS